MIYGKAPLRGALFKGNSCRRGRFLGTRYSFSMEVHPDKGNCYLRGILFMEQRPLRVSRYYCNFSFLIELKLNCHCIKSHPENWCVSLSITRIHKLLIEDVSNVQVHPTLLIVIILVRIAVMIIIIAESDAVDEKRPSFPYYQLSVIHVQDIASFDSR